RASLGRGHERVSGHRRHRRGVQRAGCVPTGRARCAGGCAGVRVSWPRARREWRATIHLALPLVGAQLAAMGTNVVDAILAGHLRAYVQAAVTTGASVWSLAIMAGIGTMLAVPPTVAQLDGAGRLHEVG